MKKLKLSFYLFYGVFMTLLAGAYEYGIFIILLFILIFSALLFIIYNIYTVLERGWNKIYEKFICERIEGYKKAKEQLKKEIPFILKCS